MNILVVCTGNICRSPMGEVILRRKLDEAGYTDAVVASAGVSDEESGRPMDRRAQKVLAANGYDIPHGRAHLATEAELRDADVILAMTTGHAHRLKSMLDDLGIDDTKVHLWREFDPTSDLEIAGEGVFGPGGALEGDSGSNASTSTHLYTSSGEHDVPDPWYGDADGFELTFDTIESSAPHIVEWLEREGIVS